MLNFQFIFFLFENSSEVCFNKKIEKMNLMVCNMCRMMWKIPQRSLVA